MTSAWPTEIDCVARVAVSGSGVIYYKFLYQVYRLHRKLFTRDPIRGVVLEAIPYGLEAAQGQIIMALALALRAEYKIAPYLLRNTNRNSYAIYIYIFICPERAASKKTNNKSNNKQTLTLSNGAISNDLE